VETEPSPQADELGRVEEPDLSPEDEAALDRAEARIEAEGLGSDDDLMEMLDEEFGHEDRPHGS
jgi:hypothetical protein